MNDEPVRRLGARDGPQSPLKNTESATDNAPTVLVVDDDPDILRIVQFYLKKQGYLTHTGGNGQEALAVLEQNPHIELVLTDVMMPGMNGLELLKAIRQNKRLSDGRER